MSDKPVSKQLPEFSPVLVEIVDRKLAPYRGRVSAKMLERMRQEALVQLSTHPYPAALLKQVTAAPVVQHSTAVPTGGDAEAKNESATLPVPAHPKRERGGGR